MKQPVRCNLQLKNSLNLQLQAVIPGTRKEGDAAEECGLENRKLQKMTQMYAVMEKSESEFAACRQSLASSYNQDWYQLMCACRYLSW